VGVCESQAIRASICRLCFLVIALVEGSIPRVAKLIRDGMKMRERHRKAEVGLLVVLLLDVSIVSQTRRGSVRSLPYSAVAGVLETSSIELLYSNVDAVELSTAIAGETKAAAKRAAAVKKRPAIVAGAGDV
jgi:hypothetical protein